MMQTESKILMELSKNVWKVYTPLKTDRPEVLFAQIKKLRNDLHEMGVTLPTISVKLNEHIPNPYFQIQNERYLLSLSEPILTPIIALRHFVISQAEAFGSFSFDKSEVSSAQDKDFVPYKNETKAPHVFNKVFVVHGHDDTLKEQVARVIEKQGLEAVILHEKFKGGNTIIENILKNGQNVGVAVCLFTADDLGREKNEKDLIPRARQNVVFEAGLFTALLGRDKVIIIAKNDLELPSDISGVLYVDSSNWKLGLLKELQGIGYPIDFSKIP